MRRKLTASAAAILALLGGVDQASAAPKLRVQVEQKGDFLLVGNTIGYECAQPRVTPIVGNAYCGLIALDQNDTAPDIFWRADADSATATQSILFSNARTTAQLNIPANATVTHAFLYWGATRGGGGADMNVTLNGPGGFSGNIPAIESYTSTNGSYQSVADITQIVKAAGSGPYRVSGVDIVTLLGLNADVTFGGWWMVVFYDTGAGIVRNLALFDGLDPVSNNNPQNAKLDGFFVPTPLTDAKLGVVTFEGDASINGDRLFFGDLVNPLSDAANPADDFFNGSRSTFGVGTHNPGDLPEMPGTAGSLAGVDIDIVDIKNRLSPGQMSADIRASSTGDTFFLAGWVTSIASQRPDFSSSNKSAVDLNGAPLLPGDTLEYTIVAENSGTDTSIDTVITDVIPMFTSYVPGSIKVTSGANTGAKTDAKGDDQGEYDAATKTVTVRVGNGANAMKGGSIPAGQSSTVTFQVKVDAGASGTISNQAFISASGMLGAPTSSTPTDGNGIDAGNPPTDVNVGSCTTNNDCPAQFPVCDPTTKACVECVTNMDCGGLEPSCDPATRSCVCVAGNSEVCGDQADNDCDGIIDDGCTSMDSDGDGLSDVEEGMIGTDPSDGDTDNDGVPDGQEVNPGEDSDGDGLINALDPDSDNDGLFDGTELGLDCSATGTDVNQGHCTPDADNGMTTTDPINADTDGGGVNDGSEDSNLNGAIDEGEIDPTVGHGDDDKTRIDSDGDGLSDDLETTIGTDPNDADSDDDGVPDGQEANPADDTDGDGLPNALDPDADNDGLYDGTELGLGCAGGGTDSTQNHCIPDGDNGATTTNPLDPDTDDGGVSDGSEDVNKDGVIDAGETDPTTGHGADDMQNTDIDGDGLSDDFETSIGSDPNDADSDDDGVADGQEPNPADDTDGDGTINVLDPDADGDGLFDGTELGLDCTGVQTDPGKNNCIPDADGGATTTSPVDPDTDNGGVADGTEDANHNGQIDSGETDPTAGHGADDINSSGPCTTDSQCGNATSGNICDSMTQMCVPGCRGEGGNGCPSGQTCTSTTSGAGVCSSEAGGTYAGWGNGILCAMQSHPVDSDSSLGWFFSFAGALALTLRRRQRSAR